MIKYLLALFFAPTFAQNIFGKTLKKRLFAGSFSGIDKDGGLKLREDLNATGFGFAFDYLFIKEKL